jgi:hypothetical protein
MWNVKTNIIPVIIEGKWNYLKIIQKVSEQQYREITMYINYTKQPHLALHTDF